MKITKQLTFIACLLLMGSLSYAMTSEKDKPINKSVKNKDGFGGLPSPIATLVSCIHQVTKYNKRGQPIVKKAYAYAMVSSLEACPQFSREFEHEDNEISAHDLQNVEWGVLSEPEFDPGHHGHCVFTPVVSRACIEGQCELTPLCDEYNSLTNPYTGSTSSLIGLDKFLNDSNKASIGSNKDLTILEHCNVGHGNPL
jgi:hypothetical protein